MPSKRRRAAGIASARAPFDKAFHRAAWLKARVLPTPEQRARKLALIRGVPFSPEFFAKLLDENRAPARDGRGDGATTTANAAKDLRRTIERARSAGDVGPGDLRRRLPRRGDGVETANANARPTRASGDLRDALSGGRASRAGVTTRAGVAKAKGRGDARVNALLRRLNLSAYEAAFAREEIDFIALRAMRDGDFDALGLPYGPKVKLARALGRR